MNYTHKCIAAILGLTAVLILFLIFTGVIQTGPLIPTRTVDTTNKHYELWFPVGETLTYKLYWGIIPVGEMVMTTVWKQEGRRKLLSIQGTARTTSVVSKIYPVDDYVESLVDPETFLPIRYTQRLREGRHKRDDMTVFDHKNRKAYWSSLNSDKKKIIPIEADTRDVLCLTYAMRANEFKPGDKQTFKVQVEDKIYSLEITGLIYEKQDILDRKNVKCIKVQPVASFGEIFQRKGKLYLWFTADARRICTRMKVRVFTLANFKSVLVDLKDPAPEE